MTPWPILGWLLCTLVAYYIVLVILKSGVQSFGRFMQWVSYLATRSTPAQPGQIWIGAANDIMVEKVHTDGSVDLSCQVGPGKQTWIETEDQWEASKHRFNLCLWKQR